MGKFIKFLIFDLIIIAIGFTFFLRMTKTVDVEWTSLDYDSAMKKTGVKVANISDVNITDVLSDKIICYGQVQVWNNFSNQEVSAVISSANDTIGPISNIKVKFLDYNQFEANFTLEKGTIDFLKETAKTDTNIKNYVAVLDLIVDTPMYIKGKLESYGKYNIDLSVEAIQLGNINLGTDIVEKVQASLSPLATLMISKYRGLSIEQLYIKENKLEFKGTLPAVIDRKY